MLNGFQYKTGTGTTSTYEFVQRKNNLISITIYCKFIHLIVDAYNVVIL